MQNELLAAYNELRNRESNRLYKTDLNSLEAMYVSPNVSTVEKIRISEKIKSIQKMYPLNLSEANRN